MKNFYYIVILFTISFNSIQAQQTAQFSQYLYNCSSINPAFVGNNDRLAFIISHRSQWVGLDGAPRSQTFSFNSPVLKNKLNAGLYILNESIGARKYTTAQASGAYQIKMGESSLSFGFKAGIVSWGVDNDALLYEDGTDPSSLANAPNSIVPNIDAGVFYNSPRFFIGASSFNLTEPQFFSTQNAVGVESSNQLKRHYFLLTGYRFKLNENLVLRPSALVKYTMAAKLNYDLSVALLIKEKFHAALTYRSSQMASAMVQYYFNSHLHAGYSFDYTLSEINNYAKGGSHEIFIGYDIFQKTKPMVTPRFL